MEALYGEWQPWKLRLVVAEMKEGFPQYRTSLANICGYSQNQSQGIELDVQKDEGCAATKGMDVAEMVTGGWRCGKDGKERGGSTDSVGCNGWSWNGSHGRQSLDSQ